MASASIASSSGLGTVAAKQVIAGQPQCENRRPGLAVAGVTADRQVTEVELQVVAVRSYQGHPALDLLRAQIAIAFGIGLIERSECLLLLAKRAVYHRKMVWRNIAMPGPVS
jgi:hypothetical protein